MKYFSIQVAGTVAERNLIKSHAALRGEQLTRWVRKAIRNQLVAENAAVIDKFAAQPTLEKRS